MFKLFINNLQVGSYKNLKQMMNSAIMVYCCGHIVKNMRWNGNKLYITTYDD